MGLDRIAEGTHQTACKTDRWDSSQGDSPQSTGGGTRRSRLRIMAGIYRTPISSPTMPLRPAIPIWAPPTSESVCATYLPVKMNRRSKNGKNILDDSIRMIAGLPFL